MKLQFLPCILGLCVLLTLQCTPKDNNLIDIKDYYYPVDSLQNGLVYAYEGTVNDSLLLSPDYWYMISVRTDTLTTLSGQYYDARFDIRQFFRQKIVPSGALTLDYSLLSPDSITGKSIAQDAEVIHANSFPFKVRDSLGVFLMELQWEGLDQPGRKTTIVRNRRFLGKETRVFKNQEIDCVVIGLRELIETEEEGVQALETAGLEWYGKGLGLVHYEKKYPSGEVISYQLIDTFPMQELTRRYEAAQNITEDE